jgi:hypothetical protein
LALFCLCNFFSNFGPNTTTFIVPGECFPTKYRATAHGISAAAGKTGSIISQVIYNGLKDHGGVTNGFVKHVMQIYALFMCFPVRHMMLTFVGYVGLVYPFWYPRQREGHCRGKMIRVFMLKRLSDWQEQDEAPRNEQGGAGGIPLQQIGETSRRTSVLQGSDPIANGVLRPRVS